MKLTPSHLTNLDITISPTALDLARTGVPLRCIPRRRAVSKPRRVVDPIEIEVRDYIQYSGPIKATEVAQWSEGEVYESALLRLLEAGIVERVGRGRRQVYRLVRGSP